MRHRSIALLCLLLTGCCQQKNWVYREVVSDCPQFDSSQLIHIPSNTFSGIEVQILQGEFGRVGFLSIYSGQILTSTFVIQIDDNQYIYEGIVMEGSQRMQMPDEATELLITALLNNQSVLVYFDSFSIKLQPENFRKQHQKFSK